MQQGKRTDFGRDHMLGGVDSYEDFKKQVPVRDYEALRDRMGGYDSHLYPSLPTFE